MDYELKQLDNIDDKSFAWCRKRPCGNFPPVALGFCGVIYQVSGFGSDSARYLYRDALSAADILNTSASLYSGISIPELSNILNIAEKFGINYDELDIDALKLIKGRNNIETVRKTATLNEPILAYVEEKDIPVKLIALILSLSEGNIRYVESCIVKSAPAVQAFRLLLQSVADFKDMPKNDGAFQPPDRRSLSRVELDNAFTVLNSNLRNIKVSSPDLFETGRLNFIFDATDTASFLEKVSSLSDATADVEKIFGMMKKYDLC